MSEEDADIDKPNTGDSTVDGYIQTAHYLDQALEEYVTDLKKKGLYDDSVIMIYVTIMVFQRTIIMRWKNY